MNPDKDLFDLIIELIEKVLGHPVSPFFEKALAVFFILAIIAIAANALILGIKTLINEVIIPVFYNKEQKRRRSRRQLFADHVEAEIRYLNSRESWNDNRFAELEAEVEAEGGRKIFGWIKINIGVGTRLRREKSLSSAIENSTVPLVLLEGDPGSGKSVALRHVAQQMARKAEKSRSLKSVIPLYINLKNLKRDEGETIDRKFIGDFVLKSINRINDRDIDEFLKDEFQSGLEEGSWFFLFDSFDEIPEILSSTESDAIIRMYAEAIRDFLHGMNRCKGIVASREYKGPRYLGWPKFRIVSLSAKRRAELIKRTNLPSTVQQRIFSGISFAPIEFRSMTSNPMFLSLLCEYMLKPNTEFPKYTHIVFEEYVSKRLERDEDRLKTRFAKSPSELRIAAEKLAFCMTADVGLGLSPTLEALRNSTEMLDLSLGLDFDTYVEALEYLKLARIDKQLEESVKLFTFAHRRFQEYFATVIVLKESWRVSSKELLSNGKWRETAVTLIQTQSVEQLSKIIETAEIMFTSALEEMETQFGDYEVKPSKEKKKKSYFEEMGVGILTRKIFERRQATYSWVEDLIIEFNEKESIKKRKQESLESFGQPIDWPKGIYHLLSILQDGITGKSKLLSPSFRALIDKYLLFVCETGGLDDKKMAIEISSISTQNTFIKILRTGFVTSGNWTKNAVYKQLARLKEMPTEFSRFIRNLLIGRMFDGNLFVGRQEVYAQLARLDKSKNFIYTARLLAWMPLIDHLLVAFSILLIFNSSLFTFSSAYSVSLIIILYIVLRWHAKPLWRLGMNLSSSNFFNNWIVTPVGSAGMFMLFGIFAWLFLVVIEREDFVISFASLSLLQLSIAFYMLILALNIWSTIALVEAFTGKRTHPIWWILFLLYPLFIVPAFVALAVWQIIFFIFIIGDNLFLITRFPLIIQKLAKERSLKPNVIVHIVSKYVSLTIFLPSLMFIPIILFLSPYILNYVFGGGLVVFLLYMFYKTGISMLKEKFELKKHNMSELESTSIDLNEFVEYLQLFNSRVVRIKIINEAIERQLITRSQENEGHLRNLISFVQAVLNENLINHYRYLKTIDPSLISSLGFGDLSEKPPKKVVWDQEQLDQLCSLLDQTRTSNINP